MQDMTDTTEGIRKQLLNAINVAPRERPELEVLCGQVWDTEQLAQDFDVSGFAAPFVVVRRKSDSQKGSLLFQHWPRYYFGFEADEEA